MVWLLISETVQFSARGVTNAQSATSDPFNTRLLGSSDDFAGSRLWNVEGGFPGSSNDGPRGKSARLSAKTKKNVANSAARRFTRPAGPLPCVVEDPSPAGVPCSLAQPAKPPKARLRCWVC